MHSVPYDYPEPIGFIFWWQLWGHNQHMQHYCVTTNHNLEGCILPQSKSDMCWWALLLLPQHITMNFITCKNCSNATYKWETCCEISSYIIHVITATCFARICWQVYHLNITTCYICHENLTYEAILMTCSVFYNNGTFISL